jgi:hypothetical protein
MIPTKAFLQPFVETKLGDPFVVGAFRYFLFFNPGWAHQ